MKDKTFLNIRLPVANRSFEMWVPNELSVFEATQLIVKIIQEHEPWCFKENETIALYLKEGCEELYMDNLIGECNLVNGTSLVLM